MASSAPAAAAVRQPRGWELVRLVRLSPAGTAVTAAWAALGGAAALLIPAVSAHAVDQVLTSGEAGSALAVLAGLLALRVLAQAGGEVAQVSASTRVLAALRYRLLRHVFALGVPGTRKHQTGDLVTRLTTNAATAAGAVPTLVTAMVASATSVGGLVALWLIDWWLAVIFLLGMVPAVLQLRRLVGLVASSYAEYLERLSAIAARLTDALAGSRSIRAAGTARREIDRVLAPLPDLTRCGMDAWAVQRTAAWRSGLILTAIRVAVLVVAGVSVAQGRISPGEFLASALYLTFALGFLSQADNLLRIGDARANAGRVLAVLAEPPQIRADRGGAHRLDRLPPGPGALSFHQVSVRLGGRLVLDRVSLDLPPGQVVAVVGRSGAGKSTLALLAGRLLDPDEGEVRIDGVRVDALVPAGLRREVAYAFDRPVLLGDTVRAALRYGDPGAGGTVTEEAARIARAADFIRRLPEGYDTPLARAPFSGGEIQRLGLARAVAHGGRVLVLDDATSSLDTVTEAELTDALTTGLAGRTRMVVAHRAVTAARADLVAWLDRGRIRAVAPHSTLWAAEPDYRAAFTGPDEDPSEDAGDGR
jgi:ATP-binding cassette subfamily B protein